jgi:hypothetical protein
MGVPETQQVMAYYIRSRNQLCSLHILGFGFVRMVRHRLAHDPSAASSSTALLILSTTPSEWVAPRHSLRLVLQWNPFEVLGVGHQILPNDTHENKIKLDFTSRAALWRTFYYSHNK